MSVVSQPSQLTVTTEERTWRATIESPNVGSYTLTIHRERRVRDASNNQVGDAVIVPPILLNFSDIGNETVTVTGTAYKVSDIAAVLKAYFDQKAQALSK